MRPPFNGEYGINAGWRYSSGAGHFAYDYDTPLGVNVYAVGRGRILASADGSPNDGPGDPNYTGEPSNWILLGTHWNGDPVSVLYQHLSPGLRVHTGQQVSEGQLLGRTGNSGNSSGPHLHFAAMRGWQEGYQRYIYMSNDGNNPYVIYPPNRLWKGDKVNLDADDRQWMRDMMGRVLWEHPVRIDPRNSKTIDYRQAVNRWQMFRSARVIAEVSAKATVDALREAGITKANFDVDRIIAKVVAGVIDEIDPDDPPADQDG